MLFLGEKYLQEKKRVEKNSAEEYSSWGIHIAAYQLLKIYMLQKHNLTKCLYFAKGFIL
jgi:hypothetical protein